jgi:AcrR family transcriptional regulator
MPAPTKVIEMTGRKSSDDRKAEILATTLDLAFEVGPENVTTGMIAARLGISQPAIYKHSKKEDIWQAVTAILCARIEENIEQAQTNGPPLERLKRLILGHLRLVRAIPALPEIMVARDPNGTLAPLRQPINTAMAAYRAALAANLLAAQEAGYLRAEIEVPDGVTLLFGIVQSLVLRLIVTRSPAIIDREGERLFDLQLALMTHAPMTHEGTLP